MTDNVVAYPDIRWQDRFTIETRRQRRTGKTMFRVWWHRENGRQYVEFDDPVALAKRLVYVPQHSATVEWMDEPSH